MTSNQPNMNKNIKICLDHLVLILARQIATEQFRHTEEKS